MGRMYAALLAIGLCASATARSGEARMTMTDLFTHQGKDWYRIPSLVVSPKGVVLAFASRRKGSVGDFGHDTDVVLRRSLDSGLTWQPMQTLASRSGIDIHHGPAVVNRKTGRVLKFCRFWPARAKGGPRAFVNGTPYTRMKELGYLDHVLWSDDEGATWTQPAPLPLPFPEGAISCATGNGSHGIQLADGRLLIQGGCVVDGTRHDCIFASDDGGSSWQRGATAAVGGSLREFGMAELADGSVYCNVRARGGHRKIARSTDRGMSFANVATEKALADPFCHAGLVRMTAVAGAPPRLFFSNPTHGRTRLTLRMSRDEGRSWPVARVVHEGPAAYSDLAILPDGTVGCLFERGTKSPYEAVAFARIPLEWLTVAHGGAGNGDGP